MAEVPLPWRSARLGWLVAVAFLAVGVPLFLRMPLWCDATLYAVAARTVSTGGVHYRDVFDTNPPGFVWLLCAVRGVLGTSSDALRLADLALVALVTVGLLWWARTAGASRAAVAWTAAAATAFYPFAHEFNHVQRDVWMMLPAGAAIGLRLGRVRPKWAAPQEPAAAGTGRCSLSLAFGDGFLWGLGCWIKPHLLFIAAGVWLATYKRFPWRDHLAVFAGGCGAGVAGVAWLEATGAWPYFVEIWTTWNADYLGTVMRELPFRVVMQLQYFPPYSMFAVLAVPLAVANVRTRSEEPAPFRRKVLAAAYLVWLLVALLLQRPFHYVHVPETLLMLAVFATNRWAVPFVIVLLSVLPSAISPSSLPGGDYLPAHPAFDETRTRWWGACVRADPPREARAGVALYTRHFGGIDPVELGAVADYLRTQNLRDGELIAWHDTPHALYLDLGIRPGFRFMHVGTAAGLGRWQEEQVLCELRAALPGARFAVSDLYRVTSRYGELNATDGSGLPVVVPAWQRGEFPFDQPVVFRSPGGRYLVHRIERPVTTARIPRELDQALPDKD
jgi:hypothetical protein